MGADSDLGFIDDRRRRLNAFLKEAVPDQAAFAVVAAQPLLRETLGVPGSLEVGGEPVGLSLKDASTVAVQSLHMTVDIANHALTEQGGDGWTLYKTSSDGISCFLKVDGANTYAMGRGPLDIDKEACLRFLSSLALRPKWDELFKWQRELQVFRAYEPSKRYGPKEDPLQTGCSGEFEILAMQLQHTAFSSPAKMIVSERDSVCVAVSAVRRKDGAVLIGLKSVADPRAPEGVDGYIRAQIIVAGFLIEDRPDGKPGCLMTTMGIVDPNGDIPKVIVNNIAPQRAFAIRDINKCALAHVGQY